MKIFCSSWHHLTGIILVNVLASAAATSFSSFDYLIKNFNSLFNTVAITATLFESEPAETVITQVNEELIEAGDLNSFELIDKFVPVFEMFKSSPEIYAHLTPFIINEESMTPRLKELIVKIPKFYHILFELSSLKDFPLQLINCFGYFAPQEIFFLHQLAPEICHAHINDRLESFLWSKRQLIPNYYDNHLIQLLDTSKYFQQVLKYMENRSFSWETRARFVQKYHVSCLKPDYVSYYWIVPVREDIVQNQHASFVRVTSKYHVDAEFISLAIKHLTQMTFLTGLMLSSTDNFDAVSTFLEKVALNPAGEREKVFEGFLSANSGPFTDEELEEIKNRNILLKSKFTFLLQNDIFTLGNLLKFGSASDIDSIDPQKYLNFFADWDPEKYSKYILLITWRRPELSEAWRRLYEKFTVKNDFVTALFAPELFLNRSNLAANLLAQKIMFIRADLPPTPNSLSFIDKFRSSVKSHVTEHYQWIAVDSQDLLPYSVYCDLFEDCLVKHDITTLKPLVKTMLKFSKLMENGIRDNFIFHHKYLQLTKPTNNLAYEILFLYSIFLNDQKAFQIVRASFQYDEKAAFKTVYCPFQYDPNESKFKFYSGFLEWRRVPAAYMGRFLMAWSGASESDLNVVLSLHSVNWNNNNLFGQDSARNYLFKLLRFFYFQTTTDISLKKDRCSAILVDEIKNVDLWYFYLKYNETSFRNVCKDFAFRFNQLPEFKLY